MNEHMNNGETVNLPMIALRGMVCFPAVQLKLEITRGFSLKAFSYAAASGGKVLLLTQRYIEEDYPGENDFFRMGTIAQIRHVVKNTDGNLSVIFEGISRAKVINLTEADGYMQGEVVPKVTSASSHNLEVDVLMNAIKQLLEDLPALHPGFTEEMRISASAINDSGMFADFVASSALTDWKSKQIVLEAMSHISRLEKLLTLLEEQMDLMRCEFEISRKVRLNIEEHQREYYLREQAKVIQQELGEDSDEIEEYAERIRLSQLPSAVSQKLKKELNRLSKTPFGAAEGTVLRNYLDACLDLPWGKTTKDKISITKAKDILDADHEGMDKVKERILEYLAVKSISNDIKNQILCLIGPPGTGKTSIAQSMAKAMQRKCVRISLGGIRDEADIRGHRKTYVGAMPGRVVQAITEAKVMNPIIVLDEIDKLSRDSHGDPASALLEVLDPEQNKFFRDHFLEIPLDLSDCIFVATANSYDGIPEPLLDRMEVIDIQSYSESEKIAIARNHLLPKQLKRHGLTKRQFKMSESTWHSLIRNYTKEAGVRNLERELSGLIRKVARKIVEGKYKSIIITPALLSEYLGKAKVYDTLPEKEDMIGVVNGLAYTQSGGDLLPIEAKLMNGQGKMELTGSLGKVMQESAQIALSYVRSIAHKHGISDDAFRNNDIHIHFPEGAIPKDGPSAGAAMTIAILSAFSGKYVRCDFALTGEMTLRGKILPIGGVREKTFAAYRNGVSNVILPIGNKNDMDEIDQVVKENLHFHFVTTFEEIASLLLVKDKSKDVATEFCEFSIHEEASIHQTRI